MNARAAIGSVLVLTLALGLSVAVAWLAFGLVAYKGGVDRAVGEAGPLIYGTVVVGAVVVVYLFAAHRPGLLLKWTGVLVIGAWLGELVALSTFGGLLANEIGPLNAWYFWLWATGGPLQPAAGLVGGWLGVVRGQAARA